jgi:hypothetical protein
VCGLKVIDEAGCSAKQSIVLASRHPSADLPGDKNWGFGNLKHCWRSFR